MAKKGIRSLRRPDMIREAGATGRGKNVFLEILIFLGVIAVTESISAVPSSIYFLIKFLNNMPEISGMISSAGSGNIPGFFSDFLNYYDEVQKLILNDTGMLIQLFSTVIVTVLVILFCKLLQKRSPKTLGLRRSGAFTEYLAGAAIGIAMMSACWGLLFATRSATVTLNANVTGMIFPLILFFIGYLLQGMSEEVVLRGYFFVSLSRKNNLAVAACVSSLTFAAMHLGNPGVGPLAIVNLTLFGFLTCIYVMKRGNLWGVCGIHSLWNFMQGNIFGVKVSGLNMQSSILFTESKENMSIINGGAFGLEGGLIVTVVEVAAILIFLFLLPEKKDEFTPDTDAEDGETA